MLACACCRQRQCADKGIVAGSKCRIGKLRQNGAEDLQRLGRRSTLSLDHSIIAASPRMPAEQPTTKRDFRELIDPLPGRRQVSHLDADGACRLAKRGTDRQFMANGFCIANILDGQLHRAIRRTLQPINLGKRTGRTNGLVELIARDVTLTVDGIVVSDRRFQVTLSTREFAGTTAAS
jgi:hypothetical protein